MYSKLLLNRKKIMFILAIGAGALLCSQSVHAVSLRDATSMTSGVCVSKICQGVDISSNNPNNVINWSSFNIGEGETVQYDQNNYLNLIHDTKASKIDGNIKGGNNVYLINPNGFLFGANSSVNVGNLYVSTRPLDGNDFDDYVNSDGFLNATTNLTGNIINLGTIQANKVVLEGNIVTLQNDANIVATNNAVTINAVNAIEVGKKPDATYIVDAWTHNENITKKFNLISNYDDLKAARNNPNANYMLACDIDALPSKNENEGNGFAYIGTYYGIFNGLNYEIKNLYINKGQASGHAASHVGLFGNLGSSGVVKNLNMVDCEIHGVEDVGAIVGCIINGGKLINCSTDASCKIYDTEFVGGLVGATKGGSIVDCVNNAYVDGWNCVGGIVGIADSGDFLLERSINNGHIYCNDDPELKHYGHDWRYENSHVGGLIGYAGMDDNNLYEIRNCSNNGNVDGTNSVGGLVGTLGNSIVADCSNNGVIAGKKGIGGLVGFLCNSSYDDEMSIKDCMNTGNVNGDSNVGGLIGEYMAGAVVNNICKAIVTGNSSVGNLVGYDTCCSFPESNKYVEPSTQTEFGISINSDNHTDRGITINPGIKIEPLSPTKPSEKLIIPADLSDKQNAINDGLKEADCLKSLFSNDFQNFSKGSSLVGETIQATKDDEETVSSRKKLILKE